MTSKPRTGTFKKNGSVNIFADPAAAQQDFTLPLPGQVGSRNVLRGNGFAEWDMSLYKTWKMPYRETHSVQFRWDVFNLANHTRFFNPDGNVTDGADFGRVKRAGDPRLMQFALKLYF